jgi:ribonuclease PH
MECAVIPSAPGSVLIQSGQTRVLCTACIEDAVPEWREKSGLGWLTAEYDMLPASTGQRRPRNRGGHVDGRVQEIQRLIGRSLRSVLDMKKLGRRTIWIDCDVLQADGGTRTAGITGAYVALVAAIEHLKKSRKLRSNPIVDSVAAVSVGLVDGRPLLDLNYLEDKDAEVDFNVVRTGRGRYVEVQGTGESSTFTRTDMDKMLALADFGISQLQKLQQSALAAGRKR